MLRWTDHPGNSVLGLHWHIQSLTQEMSAPEAAGEGQLAPRKDVMTVRPTHGRTTRSLKLYRKTRSDVWWAGYLLSGSWPLDSLTAPV